MWRGFVCPQPPNCICFLMVSYMWFFSLLLLLSSTLNVYMFPCIPTYSFLCDSSLYSFHRVLPFGVMSCMSLSFAFFISFHYTSVSFPICCVEYLNLSTYAYWRQDWAGDYVLILCGKAMTGVSQCTLRVLRAPGALFRNMRELCRKVTHLSLKIKSKTPLRKTKKRSPHTCPYCA